MKNATQLYNAATDFVQETVSETEQHAIESKSIAAFNQTGNPAKDYPIWKNHVATLRRTFKSLANQKLPSEVEAERAAKAAAQPAEAAE